MQIDRRTCDLVNSSPWRPFWEVAKLSLPDLRVDFGGELVEKLPDHWKRFSGEIVFDQ